MVISQKFLAKARSSRVGHLLCSSTSSFVLNIVS